MSRPIPSVASCAANDDLELDGRSLLRALWEEPLAFSRNRHYSALQSPAARAVRREIKLCRSILDELAHARPEQAFAEPRTTGVRLCIRRQRTWREVTLSGEAYGLLLADPRARLLRERLAVDEVSSRA